MEAQSICLVAILRDEFKFVDEWLAYHRLLGVDQFILYDDDPHTPLESYIAPHAAYAMVVPWYGRHENRPGRNKQVKAYTHSLGRLRGRFEWVGFLDLDEFITLRRQDDLKAFLGRFPGAGAVSLFWRNFGHNGYFDDPRGYVTASLTRRRGQSGAQCKTLTRISAIDRIETAHFCRLRQGHTRVDANGDSFRADAWERDEDGRAFPAYINHYYCRSFSRWMDRPRRGTTAERDAPSEQWKLDSRECLKKFVTTVAVEFNEFRDDHLLRYQQPIAEYLAGLKAFPAGDIRIDTAPGRRCEGISFCIITRGKHTARTSVLLESVRRTCSSASVPYEIVIAGQPSGVLTAPDVELVVVSDDAACERLGALRNLAASKATLDTMVFADDDLVFPESWACRLLRFGEEQPWLVAGNRVLLPDKGRFWDRATCRPSRLVAYDHPLEDPELYQSGAFMVMRREVYLKHRWDDSIPFYAERNGGLNEDVEYSRRLTADHYRFHFDPGNIVWHWNDRYEQVGDCLSATRRTPLKYCGEFQALIQSLTAGA